MSNWKNVLTIKEDLTAVSEGTLSTGNFGQLVSFRISKLPGFQTDDYLQDLAEDFAGLEDGEDAETVDSLLENLYDWADDNHNCWIA